MAPLLIGRGSSGLAFDRVLDLISGITRGRGRRDEERDESQEEGA